jgi:hypothetical protein
MIRWHIALCGKDGRVTRWHTELDFATSAGAKHKAAKLYTLNGSWNQRLVEGQTWWTCDIKNSDNFVKVYDA